MTEEVYYDMIYQKTASLMSTSCELGAITSTGKEKDRKAMVTYGTKLGMAFQVKDDLFDLLGSENQTGKDMGADVKRNMMTLPLIHTYEKLSKVETRQIKKILSLRKKSSANMADLKMIVDGAGGFTYAKQKIDEFNHQALDAISPYPDSPYKQSMVDLISFNAQRTG
jgi:octaprenyl-diphosphate synthase